MRAPEAWLRRSFRRILITLAAAPLAGTAACEPDAVDTRVPVDATVPAGDAAREGGGSVLGDGGKGQADATLETMDAGACAESIIDGSSIYEVQPDGCTIYPVFHQLPCGLPGDAADLEGCYVLTQTCTPICKDSPDAAYFLFCQLAPVSCDDAGLIPGAPTVIECVTCNGITGRRPLGLCAARRRRGDIASPLGEYFASMAHLEAASVRAFTDLERWLGALGAPGRLSRAARRSAGDERRHTRAATRLAHRFGGTVRRPRIRAVEAPPLVALLEDDAVEGCVTETFGALLASWQADHAEDPRVRRTLRTIAADELRHAALAWGILSWGSKQLSTAERRRVRRTLDLALLALEARPPSSTHASVRQIAGYPPPLEERRLALALAALVREGSRACL